MASEALGCSGGSVDLLDLASCACACLFCSAGLGSGKVGGRAGKFEEVTFAGKAAVFGIEWIWMSLVGNLMNVTLSQSLAQLNLARPSFCIRLW